MKAFIAWMVIGTFISGCAATEGPRQASRVELYEAVSSGGSNTLAVVDSLTHSTERRLPLGAASPDWKHVYAIDGTAVVDIDPATGVAMRTQELGASYQLPAVTAGGMPGGLSPDGRWLVLERFDPANTGTHMALIDTDSLQVTRKVDLRGNFQFDAVNNSGTGLYLIQHVGGGEYYVRLYDLASGTLTPDIVVDKRDGNEAMAGLRLSGVPSPGGNWLFSVYVREHAGPFVHALNLDGPFALCIDLPGTGYMDDPNELQWSLALDPRSGLLYAVNPATGAMVEITTAGDSAPGIARTKRFGVQTVTAGHVQAENAAVVAGHMVIAAGPSGIAWIDIADLSVRSRALEGWQVSGVGLSPDGKTLYAVADSGRIAVIEVSSGKITSTFNPSAGRPMALMRVVVST